MNALSDKCLKMKLFRFAFEIRNKEAKYFIKKSKTNKKTRTKNTPLDTEPLKTDERLSEGY